MYKKTIYIFIILIELLSSCGRSNNIDFETANNNKEECLLPEYDFSIAIMPYEDQQSEKEIIMPDEPWKMETTIPYLDNNEINKYNIQYWLKGIREKDNQNEIWILEKYYSEPGNFLSANYNYYIFYTESHEWERVSASPNIEENEKLNYISDLYITNSGQVWGMNMFSSSDNSKSMISYFDDIQNIFIEDKKSEKTKSIIQIPNSNTKNIVVFDPKGILWILESNIAIYRYELISGKLSKEIDLEKGEIYGAQISPEDNIYYVRYVLNDDEPGIQEGVIFEYSPVNHEISTIKVPREGLYEKNSVSSFFVFDIYGNLWIENKVYRDLDGNWYDILDNPLFITNNWVEEKSDRQINYSPLLARTASSDGNVWFTGEEGTYKANAIHKSWCWVSTEQSIVLEDGDGYLWMVAGNELYKRPLDK